MQYIKKEPGAGIGAKKLECNMKKNSDSTDRKSWCGRQLRGAFNFGIIDSQNKYTAELRQLSRPRLVSESESSEMDSWSEGRLSDKNIMH